MSGSSLCGTIVLLTDLFMIRSTYFFVTWHGKIDATRKTDILNVYRFVDWILSLPKPLEKEFWQELKAYEEDRKMPYITSVERIGFDRGNVEKRRI